MHDIFDMQTSDYPGIDDATGFDAQRLEADRADQHFATLDETGKLKARCSIWWRDIANVRAEKTGAIGHYAAVDSTAAHTVLQHALRELKNRGCGIAVGPMDGSTWRRYRFITERGTAKPFFLEPDNPEEWPSHFTGLGFSPLAHYVSEINYDMANRQPELGDLRRKFSDLGVRIAPVNVEDPVDDMAGIYKVVCESFKDAFMYTPLDIDSYASLYAPLLDQVDPRLMLVAKHDDEVVGFIIAPPDFLQLGYQHKMDAIVLKTIAVLPRKQYSGLGRVLIVDLLKNAVDMGFTTAISALMHVENRSQKISSDCAGPMRGYTLFAKDL
ncbi:MAG: GNAT family N-acetyltransferase [Woeseiaceae bacterium]|nr:GNAT family N-acetyltransferase [Woeseiaceae bacterium]